MKTVSLILFFFASIFSLRLFGIADEFENFKLWSIFVFFIWAFSLAFMWWLHRALIVFLWFAFSLTSVFFILKSPMLIGYSVDVSSTKSNFPTIQDGDIIISRHFNLNYSRGGYVGFFLNGDLYRKRIYGVPGDKIFQCDKHVYVNGFLYIAGKKISFADDFIDICPHGGSLLTLGPDEFYLLGDNLDNSYDSRVFGPVSRESIVANSIYKIASGKSIYLDFDM